MRITIVSSSNNFKPHYIIISKLFWAYWHHEIFNYKLYRALEVDLEHAKPQRNADIAKSVEDVQEMIDTV